MRHKLPTPVEYQQVKTCSHELDVNHQVYNDVSYDDAKLLAYHTPLNDKMGPN